MAEFTEISSRHLSVTGVTSFRKKFETVKRRNRIIREQSNIRQEQTTLEIDNLLSGCQVGRPLIEGHDSASQPITTVNQLAASSREASLSAPLFT